MTTFPRIPADMFRFSTTERAELHTATLYAFGEANERLETALTFDDVRARLRSVGWYDAISDDELAASLSMLHRWELIDIVQNHGARYATAEEYERKNLQYSLTKRGEAAFEGTQHALGILTSSGALQTAVLEAIADRLNELYELLQDTTSSNRRIYTTLTELESHLEALRTNTKQFNGELQRLLRDDAADLTTFHEVKRATITYLQEFITNLDRRKQAIANALARVEERGVTVLHHRALVGAELPTFTGTDPGPAWLAHRAARWDGLRLWFRPEHDAVPRVDELLNVARRAIVSLLRVLERASESRRRSSSAATDFRVLARWFAAAPTEADAHRLWCAAFGLWPARHAHLGHDDIDAVPPTTSWSEAPAVELSPLLRTSGKVEHVARTARVRDVGAIRAQRQLQARRERAELEAALAELATDGSVRLSSIGRLPHSSFERLLDMVGKALASRPDRRGVRRCATADSLIQIVLGPPLDGRQATIHTSHGRFTGPDYLISIQVAGRPADSLSQREA